MQVVDLKIEDRLKQKHAAVMWTSLTKGREGHYDLECKGAIRDCRERPSLPKSSNRTLV